MSDLSMAIGAFERAVLERDSGLAASVLDADFTVVQVEPAPSSVTRTEWLESLRDTTVHDHEVLERFVHEDGETAAVLQKVRMSATLGGDDRAGIEVLTDVWRLRADGWRLWRRHFTPPAGDAAATSEEHRAARTADLARPAEVDKATVTEVAAVLAAIANAGHDPAELTPADMEQYVEAFRALKQQV
ncbi:MAG: nuclear transport factor 2 family protein [Actinomycetota bacterium]|nr:nuclear transport factor 2 family protein [Actinomycetota bacterium]